MPIFPETNNGVLKGSHSSIENLLPWNCLMAWSKIAHISQVYEWSDTTIGLWPLLTCAKVFINHAWALLEMGSELDSFGHDHEIRGRENGLERLHLSNLSFQVRQNSLNLLTEALMKCRAIPSLLGILLPVNSLVTYSQGQCLDGLSCTCWLYK